MPSQSGAPTRTYGSRERRRTALPEASPESLSALPPNSNTPTSHTSPNKPVCSRYTWEKTKEKLEHYRRRSPEASSLYQIVYHSRDDLQFQWIEETFAERVLAQLHMKDDLQKEGCLIP